MLKKNLSQRVHNLNNAVSLKTFSLSVIILIDRWKIQLGVHRLSTYLLLK